MLSSPLSRILHQSSLPTIGHSPDLLPHMFCSTAYSQLHQSSLTKNHWHQPQTSLCSLLLRILRQTPRPASKLYPTLFLHMFGSTPKPHKPKEPQKNINKG